MFALLVSMGREDWGESVPEWKTCLMFVLVHWWFYAAVVTGFVCVVFEDGLTLDGVYCSLRAGEAHAYSTFAYQNKVRF